MAVSSERRRLSVGVLMESPAPSAGSPKSAVSAREIKALKDRSIFDCLAAGEASNPCVCITSTTDRIKERKGEFGEKDADVQGRGSGWGEGGPLTGASAKQATDWLRERGMSWCCKKGKKPEAPNQDSYSILVVEGLFALYGVYDGHGPFGHDVSDLVAVCLPKLFLEHPNRASDPKMAFEESFVAMQRLTEAATKARMIDAQSSGTTCTMVYRTFPEGRVTVAHVGDSRAVNSAKKAGKWETTDLTIDHKPNLPEEKRRIESADPPGRVVFDGYYNHRVFAQKEMIPGLNMSRAIGDIVAHQRAGLTAHPDTKTVTLEDGSNALWALCSDGVWEFIESEDFMTFMGRADVSLQDRCETFAREAFNRWMKDSEDEISDDITIIAFTSSTS